MEKVSLNIVLGFVGDCKPETFQLFNWYQYFFLFLLFFSLKITFFSAEITQFYLEAAFRIFIIFSLFYWRSVLRLWLEKANKIWEKTLFLKIHFSYPAPIEKKKLCIYTTLLLTVYFAYMIVCLYISLWCQIW